MRRPEPLVRSPSVLAKAFKTRTPTASIHRSPAIGRFAVGRAVARLGRDQSSRLRTIGWVHVRRLVRRHLDLLALLVTEPKPFIEPTVEPERAPRPVDLASPLRANAPPLLFIA